MPRLLHMADVHLGARHRDLGDAAATQRERQFDAFKRAIDVALARARRRRPRLRRPVRLQRAAAPLGRAGRRRVRRLADGRHPTVVIPGTHDVYDPASIYRAFDLPALAGLTTGGDLARRVLTPERPDVVFPTLDLVVYGRVSATKRMRRQPARRLRRQRTTRRRAGGSGMIHGSLRIQGKVEPTTSCSPTPRSRPAASTTSPSATGTRSARACRATRRGPTPVRRSPSRSTRTAPGRSCSSTLSSGTAASTCAIGRGTPVGRTRFEHLDVDAAGVALARTRSSRRSVARPTRTSCSTCASSASAPDELELDDGRDRAPARAGFFLGPRPRPLGARAPEGLPPPPDTIVGAFIRDLEARIAAAEAAGDADGAAEQREVAPARPRSCSTTRIGDARLMRITRLQPARPPAAPELDLELAPGLTIVRGPNEAGKSTIQRAIELGLFRKCTAAGQDIEALRRWGAAADAAPMIQLEFEATTATAGSLAKTLRRRQGHGRAALTATRRSPTRRAVERRLAELTGLPSEKFFRSTARVRHEELADLDRDEGAPARPPPGGDERRRPRHRCGAQEARRRHRPLPAPRAPRTRASSSHDRRERSTLEASLRDGEAGAQPARGGARGAVRGARRARRRGPAPRGRA